MREIIFATSNEGKLREVKAALEPLGVKVLSLKSFGSLPEAPETASTFLGNALQKGKFYSKKLGRPVLAEDDGLEIFALGMEPGVYTGRYSQRKGYPGDPVDCVLHYMKDKKDRRAQFRSAMVIVDGDKILCKSEGICKGKITNSKTENNTGMRFDAVFIPEGSSKSFGEMGMHAKAGYSHRSKALNKIKEYLSK